MMSSDCLDATWSKVLCLWVNDVETTVNVSFVSTKNHAAAARVGACLSEDVIQRNHIAKSSFEGEKLSPM